MTMTEASTGNRSERQTYSTSTRHAPETKGFLKTSEFWAMLAGVVAVAAIYNAASDASLDLWRACLLATTIGVAYIVSRGVAKAGARRSDDVDYRRD